MPLTLHTSTTDTPTTPDTAPPPARPKRRRPPGEIAACESRVAVLIADTEAAALCGIARATWHRLRAAGRIGPTPVRLGRSVRYRRSEVIAWAEAGAPDARTWAAMRAMEGRRSAHRV